MPLPLLNRTQGKLEPTDYQTAMHVRGFLQRRLNGQMLTEAQLDYLRRTGNGLPPPIT